MRDRRPKFSVDVVRRAEETLARIGIKFLLSATSFDRDDLIELHVGQLVDLLAVKQPSRKRAKKLVGQ